MKDWMYSLRAMMAPKRPAGHGPTPRTPLGAHARFSRFCAVGAVSLAVDYAVLVPLVHPGLVDARGAAAIAYLVSSVAGYLLNRRLTFADRSGTSVFRGMVAYIVVGLGGAVIRLAVLHLCMVLAHFSHPPEVYLASGLGILAGTLANYLGALRWVFPAAPAQVLQGHETTPRSVGEDP